ncbi:ParA family protein [Azomonas macrocytogenes]|uniref:Chromosome partitioning protein n=1 Tax=Azomonas macrocytogenes TaxID=69962 RepID=A0A839T739_AZOMA|nr:ParA family protein [Azomonas macrocytogenes]MBB3105272.1 chromosome partitioning protein [Azomonas macrocytogenes]
MISQENIDELPYTDYKKLTFSAQKTADLLGLHVQTVHAVEEDLDIAITRVERGSASHRIYSLDDIFKIAWMRREKGKSKGFSRPVTLATYISKGGTSKTTSAVNLAIQFNLAGLRTLIIDNDPQGDASTMLGYDPDYRAEDLVEKGLPAERAVEGHFGHLLELPGMQSMKLDQVIKKPFGEYGPHLIPAEAALEDIDTFLRLADGSDFRYALFLEQARSGAIPDCDLSPYDIVIIDNAPTGTMLARNAMVAADMLICPIRMDKFSFRALARLDEKLRAFARAFKRLPEIAAIPSMLIKGRPRVYACLDEITRVFPGKMTSPVYMSEDYNKSLELSIPLSLWSPAKKQTQATLREVAGEILERIRTSVDGGLK